MSPGSPAPDGGSAAAQRPCERGCTDRSADRCADRHTAPSVRARAVRGPQAAEAVPRRRVRWRSRGRRWRGPSARATERPCCASVVPAGSLPAVCPRVPRTPLGREPLRQVTGLCQPLERRRGRPRTVAWADCGGWDHARASACANVLSTRAGENRAHGQPNWCHPWGFGRMPAEEARGGEGRRAASPTSAAEAEG
jgi:hypothetical protein